MFSLPFLPTCCLLVSLYVWATGNVDLGQGSDYANCYCKVIFVYWFDLHKY